MQKDVVNLNPTTETHSGKIGVIPVGDKCSPAEIGSYFHGMTKTDFKQAVGMLFREGKCKPGPYETR